MAKSVEPGKQCRAWSDSVSLIWIYSAYHNIPKFSDKQVWANSADPDQLCESDLDLLCLP